MQFSSTSKEVPWVVRTRWVIPIMPLSQLAAGTHQHLPQSARHSVLLFSHEIEHKVVCLTVRKSICLTGRFFG